jgi:serpin B
MGATSNTIRISLLLLCFGLAGYWAGSSVAAPDNADAIHASKRAAAAPDPALTPAAATEAFGLDLIGAQPGNVVLSPGSVATALAMAGTGASGQTAAQMAATLHLKEPAAFDAVGSLQRTIAREQAEVGEGRPNAPTLEMANGLFLQQGFPLRPEFLGGLQRNFGATPEAVDFQGDPTGSTAAINSWVSDRTKGVIPKLFESLSASTRLVLANAIYLKAKWRHGFGPAMTAHGPFYGSAGKASVEFMNQIEQLRYSAGRGYKAVELPYRASTLSMLVVLPVGEKVGALQRRLSAEGLAPVVQGLSQETVDLRLPRFHLNTRTSLKDTLESLGMTAAFTDLADFSRMTALVGLKIDAVEHVADLAVDEEGTIAAAATGVSVALAGAPGTDVTFNANRPFLFFVRDSSTGAVLFAGRLTNPTSAGTS